MSANVWHILNAFRNKNELRIHLLNGNDVCWSGPFFLVHKTSLVVWATSGIEMFKNVGKCYRKVKKIVLTKDTFHNLYLHYTCVLFSLASLLCISEYKCERTVFVLLILFHFFILFYSLCHSSSMLMLAIFRAMQTDSTCIQNGNSRFSCRVFSHFSTVILVCLF